MFRLILSILKWLVLIAVVVFATVQLSGSDEVVTFTLRGETYSPPLWVAVVALVLLIIAAIMLYSLYRAIMDAPSKIRSRSKSKKMESGYEALSTGMVALAAGDADEAKRHASRADRLLKSPPITNLLAAQSAQLKGDEKAARRFFAEMLKSEDTKFLGLRGLINQGLRDGRHEEALLLAREAQKMRPDSKWVLEALFDLETRSGNMLEAQEVVKRQRSLSHISAEDSRQKQSVLMIEKSRTDLDQEGTDSAVSSARIATKLDPKNAAGAKAKARALMAAERFGEARRTIEAAWGKQPQEELVPLYFEISGANDAASRAKAVRKLAKSNKRAALSNVLLAELAISDQKWDEAQAYLLKAEEAGPSERGYKLMAQVEMAMGNDSERVQEHMMKAIDAKGAGRWTCESCGSHHDDWAAICDSCDAFGAISWQEDEGRKSARSLIEPTPSLLSQDTSDDAEKVEGKVIDADTTPALEGSSNKA